MKQSIFKVIESALVMALVLSCVGCNSKSGSMDKSEKEEVPTVAYENNATCDTGGLGYDNPSQGEEETIVPGESGEMNKDKFKNKLNESIKKKGIYIGEVQGEELEFKSKVIKTGSYTSGKNFPSIGIYRSTKDLGAIDYINYGTGYDEEFFKTKALIVIELRETSGSIRNEVTRVVKNDDKITVEIKKTVPEIGTADMAEWAIFVEIDNSAVNDKTTADFVFK